VGFVLHLDQSKSKAKQAQIGTGGNLLKKLPLSSKVVAAHEGVI